jgi:hypothetical protein
LKIIEKVNAKADKYLEIYWQTKNPQCLNQYLPVFPKNSVLLKTLETNLDAGYEMVSSAPPPSTRAIAFASLPWPRKMITIEPIMDFDQDIFIEWISGIRPSAVWIGFNSKNSSLSEPPLQKVLDFIKEIKGRSFEVREKKMISPQHCSHQK